MSGNWLLRSVGYALRGMLLVLVLLWGIAAARFYASVTLPDGLVVKRVVDLKKYVRDDLFAGDGRTRLALDLESLCFDDRHLWVTTYGPGGGLYDGQTGHKVADTPVGTGLWAREVACNGYYTAMMGAGLLYLEGPWFPSCDPLNLDNPALQRRDWFDRPCWPKSP